MKVKQQERIRGYWFSLENKLPHGDGRVVEVGATHSVEGRIEICYNGLHFCQSPLDALKYAPGEVLWGIEAWDDLFLQKDKGVARFRTYLWRLDATELLREFSRWCALQVARLWDAPPVAMEFLKTGDPSLRQKALDEALSYCHHYTNPVRAGLVMPNNRWDARVERFRRCASATMATVYAARLNGGVIDTASAANASRDAFPAFSERIKFRDKQRQRFIDMIEETRA